MTRRLNAINAYSIDGYIITLERLHNTNSGNPRFKAVIIKPEDGSKAFYNAVYTFSGHYLSDIDEAREILRQHKTNNNLS